MHVDHGHRRIDRDFHLPTTFADRNGDPAEDRGLLVGLALGVNREARNRLRIAARFDHAQAARNRAPV